VKHFLTPFHCKSQQGSGLIEIIVATGVMALVLTAIIAGLTLSLRTSSETEYRSQSVKRAQEAMEVFRRERTIRGWEAFVDSVKVDSTYCMSALPSPQATWDPGVCDPSETFIISGQEFTREAIVVVDETVPTDVQVRVKIIVSWVTDENSKDVQIFQTFRKWN
jgi:type II secretory pathway pseudopilin PulG